MSIDNLILCSSFQGQAGKVYSLIDATFGLGFTLGPTIGAIFYQLGGFMLPFMVCGGSLVLTGTSEKQKWINQFDIRVDLPVYYVSPHWPSRNSIWNWRTPISPCPLFSKHNSGFTVSNNCGLRNGLPRISTGTTSSNIWFAGYNFFIILLTNFEP